MAKVSGYEKIRAAVNKKDHVFALMNKMNEMRVQRRGCDLVIRVAGKEIPVHRNIMMAGSDFFDAMFTHDMLEKHSGVVEMKDVSFRAFNKCVEFIYTGDICLFITECEELLFAAGMLQLSTVCNNIAPFLQSHLSPSSFFTTKNIANKFSLVNLSKACDDYALRHLGQIVREKEFDNLEKEYISFLITSKKSIGCESEESKLAIVLQWMKADVESRKQYLLDLITLLDFQKISPACAKYLTNREQLCYTSFEFTKMLLQAVVNDSSIEEKKPTASFDFTDKSSLLVFDQTSSAVKCYNPRSKDWTHMQTLHQDINAGYHYTCALVENFIYVLLGNKKAYRLNIRVNSSTWQSVQDMLHEHTLPRAAVCEGDIYIIGDSSMERFSVVENEWREVNCDGSSSSSSCTLAVYDSCLYTIGGYSLAGDELVDVNRYCTSISSWSSVVPMPSARVNAAATVHRDKIYVAGGYCDGRHLNDLMSFDPHASTWTQLSPMLNGRYLFELHVIANQLFSVGNGNHACSIEVYDFDENRWKIVSEEDKNMKIMAPATVAI